MRYPASEKLEIIRTGRDSRICRSGARWTRSAFRRRRSTPGSIATRTGGLDALEDRKPRPAPRLEPHPRRGPRQDHRAGAGRAGTVAARGRRRFHRCRKILRLRGQRLSAPESRTVSITSPAFIVMKAADAFAEPDNRNQPALADRLHLPEGHRLGLVLSLDRARRLLALHRRLEALHRR